MKTARGLGIFTVVILIAITMASLPAAPARADRGITISPEEGPIGTRVTITGTEFNKSTADYDRYAAIYMSSQPATVLDDIGSDVTIYEMVDSAAWLDYDGDFETSILIPGKLNDGSVDKDVTGGTYYLYVCHYVGTTVQTRIRAIAEFTVTAGEISVYPLRGAVDTLVEINGVGFVENEDIIIKYDGGTIPIHSGSKQTDSSGGFTSLIRIPDSTAGEHTISANVSGDRVSVDFTVYPEILISPSEGKAGTSVDIVGTGFGKQKRVTVWLYNASVATDLTNALGTFQGKFTIPDIQAGLYYIDAEEGDNLAKARFNLTEPSPPPVPTAPEQTPSTSISAATGSIGQGLVMSGSGFKANTTVTIKYDDILLSAVNTDGNGVFAAAFKVPASVHGDHRITASDGANTSEITFAVESTAPPPPKQVQPAAEAKVKAPLLFAWLDVADPSQPVTYDIQVADSSDFSGTSIVLEKTGLTKPAFSLTETERKSLDIGKDRYFWRVRATDSAANTGEWSYPREFNLVTTAIPVWSIVVISLIVVLLLVGIGYLLRMKTGFFR